MMELFAALWHTDYEFLINANQIGLLIICLTGVLLLENGFVFLPLPGDSLVILAGGLVGLGIIGPEVSMIYLPLAAGLGGVFSYEQGRWLSGTQFMHRIERSLPNDVLPRAKTLFENHGTFAMFIARFIPFVRALVPMLMGASEVSRRRFAIVSFVSAFLWSMCLGIAGAFFVSTNLFVNHADLVTKLAISVPVLLFIGAISATGYRLAKQR
ncbi:DedA family protein [Thaumasiovibrio subtropicus]|uniref:DedA family protein n=1 Tax=Thaumasiovibrio subtropicus TaxID=1891207 RepID=UPI000B363C2B|nr:DedA family protein [Thaumasiovibrio subtropicus]